MTAGSLGGCSLFGVCSCNIELTGLAAGNLLLFLLDGLGELFDLPDRTVFLPYFPLSAQNLSAGTDMFIIVHQSVLLN